MSLQNYLRYWLRRPLGQIRPDQKNLSHRLD
jgi:hypothetical protein